MLGSPIGRALICALGLSLASASAVAETAASAFATVPTGQIVTPTAAPGARFLPLEPDLPQAPGYRADHASALALSPDGRTLLVLTSGFNKLADPSGMKPLLFNEFVFVFDVTGGALRKRQVLTIPNSFLGLGWAPSGDRFYVSGGVNDDVLEFVASADGFRAGRAFPLGHKAGLGIEVKPEAAGLAVSPDGRRLAVANLQNDSVSLIDLDRGTVAAEQDLRPGVIDPTQAGRPGGTFPRAVAWASAGKLYVTSERDREIVALQVSATALSITARIPTRGQPVALLASRSGRRLYAALDNTDGLAVIDTATDRIVERLPTAAPQAELTAARGLGGAGSNSLALSPDGRTLYLTNGGENAAAVVRLGATALDPSLAKGPSTRPRSAVLGLISTGWYPSAIATSANGERLFVANGKSNPGPNPGACRNTLEPSPVAEAPCRATNQYVWQLEKAGLLALPTPTPAVLAQLTRRVAVNDGFAGRETAADRATMRFLRARIRHVIYVVKENRTYDQILGDLGVGDGDPRLTLFPNAMSPNHHALAKAFVTLDRYRDSGESSNTGWVWSTAARDTDFTEREAPVNYADRGLQYDQEGPNRNVNVGLPTASARVAANPATPNDPNLLPGTADVAAPDGTQGEAGEGYIWDQALRAGLSVRNWGFFGDLVRYDDRAGPIKIPLDRDPFASHRQVFFPAKPALMRRTDIYYRGFDQAFPDYWRLREWKREFDGFVAHGRAPNLMLVRLPHDHFGQFGKGLDGVTTVETEMADNDYALGLLVQTVAESRFAKDTLIFVTEDDAQDGADHVDAHRSICFVLGPYVKHGAVISKPYTTVNLLRTMEEVLGLAPLGLNDALAEPMAVFDPRQASWSYRAVVPLALRRTSLPLPRAAAAEAARAKGLRLRSAAYWAKAMAGQDFSSEDRLDTPRFNQALWRGLKGSAAPAR